MRSKLLYAEQAAMELTSEMTDKTGQRRIDNCSKQSTLTHPMPPAAPMMTIHSPGLI
jgi:hypothetical protein